MSEEKTKKELRAEERAAKKAAKKAARQGRVVVTVRVEGQVAFKGNATIPGYSSEIVGDEAVEGAIRSAALRVISTAKLQDSVVIRKKLHEVHEEANGG